MENAIKHLHQVNSKTKEWFRRVALPIDHRKEEAKWGTYRTKDTILEIYEALAEAHRTGQLYTTRLDPPPADPRCCHSPKQVPKR